MIGDNIKYRREQLNMSQDELAKKLGYKSRSSINKIELNLQDIPQKKIVQFAKALNTSVSYLMDWSDNKSNDDKSIFNSQFGTDQEIIDFFHDQPELLEMYKGIQQSDSLQLLFDSTKDLSPEDLKPVLEYIYTIRKAKGLE